MQEKKGHRPISTRGRADTLALAQSISVQASTLGEREIEEKRKTYDDGSGEGAKTASDMHNHLRPDLVHPSSPLGKEKSTLRA